MGRKRKPLSELCTELNIAIHNELDYRCTIISPRPLTAKERKTLESYLEAFPKTGITYIVGVKDVTLSSLKFLLISNKISYILEEESRLFRITTNMEIDAPIKDEITRIFKEDGYPVGWSLFQDKEFKYTVNFKVLEAMQGRDLSKESIGSDDLTNLKIALGTADSVEDFIKAM